jgi:hypothetical protein
MPDRMRQATNKRTVDNGKVGGLGSYSYSVRQKIALIPRDLALMVSMS